MRYRRNVPNGSETPETETNGRRIHGATRRIHRTGFGGESFSATGGRSATTRSAPPSKRLISSGRCSGWSVKSACMTIIASRRG